MPSMRLLGHALGLGLLLIPMLVPTPVGGETATEERKREYEVEVIIFDRLTYKPGQKDVNCQAVIDEEEDSDCGEGIDCKEYIYDDEGAADGKDTADKEDIDDKEDDEGEQWNFASRRTAERLRRMRALAGEINRVEVEHKSTDDDANESTEVEVEVGILNEQDFAEETEETETGSTEDFDEESEYSITDALINMDRIRVRLLESGYCVLATASWIQESSSRNNAPIISLGNEDSVLSAGFVRIYTTSLIYADVDLQLTPFSSTPVSPIDETKIADDYSVDEPEPLAHYFITEKRRLKFNDVHYFDHPLFGAILGVWPVE